MGKGTITNIIFIYLLAPFILQKFKKIHKANPELWGCAIFGPKIAQFILNKKFLVQTIIITFIYLLALFIGQNLKTILTAFLQFLQFFDHFWSFMLNGTHNYIWAPNTMLNFRKN